MKQIWWVCSDNFTFITKTCPCNAKIFFQQSNLKLSLEKNDIFDIAAENIDCGYTLEPPHQARSNGYQQSMFWIKNKKKIGIPLHNPLLLYKKGG